MSKLTNLKDKIEGLLRCHTHLRDDDMRLTANIWHYEMKGKSDFLTAYANKDLTMADTITRLRRKIQEDNPDLRGTKWEERHEKEEKVIKDLREINY